MPYELTFDVLWQTRKHVPLLGGELLVMFISEVDKQPPTNRQFALLDSLDNLTSNITSELAAWARKDFKQRLEDWGMTSDELAQEISFEIDEHKIQDHFRIEQVVIPRIAECSHDYVFLCGECDWDVEHGIEFLLKDGVPVRCNAQEGLYSSAEWKGYLAQ